MMNCFEARQDFVGFWQSALDGERRRELLAHLKGCSKCDRAFRAFALTAPMLHSGSDGAAAEPAIGADQRAACRESAPPDVPHPDMPYRHERPAAAPTLIARPKFCGTRRFTGSRIAARRVAGATPRRDCRRWLQQCCSLYFSVAAPSQSFDDALANPDSISETSAQPDTDFLGQQIPTIPAVSNDLAG